MREHEPAVNWPRAAALGLMIAICVGLGFLFDWTGPGFAVGVGVGYLIGLLERRMDEGKWP